MNKTKARPDLVFMGQECSLFVVTEYGSLAG